MGEFAHVEDDAASMVDVTEKDVVHREAVAAGRLDLQPTTIELLGDDETPADDVFATARVAAVSAVKRTWDDIPYCHQIPVTDVSVSFDVREEGIESRVAVTSTGKTGVEMEALNGVSRALLTCWDMVKSAEKSEDGDYPDTRIRDVRVVRKEKGEPTA